MAVKKLFLTNFRNIKKCEIDVSAHNVVLKGENGQGKTNLLEAIYILCYGSSFRTQNLKDAVNYSSDYFYLSSDFEDSDSFERMTEISFSNEKKLIRIDGKQIKDRKELIYTLPCIIFSHDDIEIVRGEPENRRRFFDQTMTMYDPAFFEDLRAYKNVLRQRNAAIKAHRADLLDIYDLKLASLGIPIIEQRKKVCEQFSAIFPDLYNKVSQDDRKISILYKPSWNCDLVPEVIAEKLLQQRETDLKLNTTTSGPHRDRFIVMDENGIFSNGASTGQMRLASLVLKSAQAEFYRKKTSKDPVLLIDDVLLELDSEKRARYLEQLGSYSQAFLTFLPDEKYFSSYGDDSTLVYNVKNGGFEHEI